MTISGTYTQSFSFSLSIATVRIGTAASQQPSTPGATEPADSVTLSPAATSQPTTPTATAPAATEPAPAAPKPSPSAQKAETLMNALDADDDGSITEEEFTEGALALLGRSRRGDRHGSGDESDHGVERHGRHSRRLERRLEKVFDRVDANDDGTLDATELKNALARTERKGGKHAGCGQTTPAATEQTPATQQSSYTSVTVVAVAVKQYTAISAAA